MIENRIRLFRRASAVKRFHTAPIIHGETVGEHSFNVVNLIFLMTEGKIRPRLITAALFHDLGEVNVGDIPSPIKKLYPQDLKGAMDELEEATVQEIHPKMWILLRSLDEEEQRILKLADNLDGVLKCGEELALGNRNMRAILERYVSYVYELTEHWDTYREFAEKCIHIARTGP